MQKATLKSMRSLGKVRARRVFTGFFHADNHDDYIAYIGERIKKERPNANFKLQLEEPSNCIRYIENDVPTNYFWFLPKIKTETLGVVEFRSHDFRFLPDGDAVYSYGPKLTKDCLRDYGFAIDLGKNEYLEYHILD